MPSPPSPQLYEDPLPQLMRARTVEREENGGKICESCLVFVKIVCDQTTRHGYVGIAASL